MNHDDKYCFRMRTGSPIQLGAREGGRGRGAVTE